MKWLVLLLLMSCSVGAGTYRVMGAGGSVEYVAGVGEDILVSCTHMVNGSYAHRSDKVTVWFNGPVIVMDQYRTIVGGTCMVTIVRE